jgi:hypothetical protein
MEILSLKTKIAVMWVSMSVVDLFTGFMRQTMGLSLPASFQSMETFENLFWVLVPLLMAVLTLCLKDAGSRWTNVVVGIIIAISSIAAVIISITWADPVPIIIIILSTVVLTILITVYSLRWPKYKQI